MANAINVLDIADLRLSPGQPHGFWPEGYVVRVDDPDGLSEDGELFWSDTLGWVEDLGDASQYASPPDLAGFDAAGVSAVRA